MKAIDLISDNLKEHPLWSSLAEIAQDIYDTKLGAPLRELDRIRHIDEDTDPVLVERAIRQAGLTISNELFKLNRDNLRLNYHELIKFWEHNGTPRYPRVISFILGRSFSETVLYTTDYVDFEATPGRLNVDGGSWYATSHVDLQVDAAGLRESLNLRIQSEDIEPIKEALSFSQRDEAGKDEVNALIDELQSREIDLDNDDQRIIQVLVRNRILRTYYQFAPIEKVVREIYLSVTATANLLIAGTSLARNRKYWNSNAEKIVGYILNLPSKLQGMRDYTPHVRVTWSDTTRTEQFPMSIDDDTIQSELYPDSITQTNGNHIRLFENNLIMFEDVDEITTVELEIRLRGIVWTDTFELYPSGVPFNPDELYLTGPSKPLENGDNRFNLVARYDNVREPADLDRTVFTIDTPLASFEDNRLHIQEIFDPVAATVTATYRLIDGTTQQVFKPVTLTPEAKPLTAKSLRIIVETRQDDGTWIEIDPEKDIEQGYDNIYVTPAVQLSDNTEILLASRHTEELGDTEAPIAQWFSSTGTAYIEPDGRVVSPVIYRDFSATFTAEATVDDRNVRGSVTIRFKRPRIFITGLEIIGPDSVLEETRTQYRLQATWNTGEQTFVVPEWISRDSATARAGRIDEQGLFYAPTVDADSESINIDAALNTIQFDADDNETIVRMQPTTKVVTVAPLERRVNTIDFQVLDSLRQGNTNGIRFYADWNDDTSTEIIPYRIELRRGEEIISTYIRGWTGSEIQDLYIHADRNPVTLRNDPGEGITPPARYTAPEDNVEHDRFQIDYLLPADSSTVDAFNGLVEIVTYYVNPVDVADPSNPPILNDATLETLQGTEALVVGTKTISVVPKIFLSESIEIIAPAEMRESSRVFLAAIVTYENGDQEQVNAVWEVQALEADQEIEADLSQGAFGIDNMINSLLGINRDWFETGTLSDTQIQTLIDGELIFRALSEGSIADWTTTVRDLIDKHNVSNQLADAAIPQDPSSIEGAITPSIDLEWLEAGNELDDNQVLLLVDSVDRFRVLNDQNSNRTNTEWTGLLLAALQEYPEKPFYQRALIQTRPLPDGTEQQFKVAVQYFRQEDQVLITNVSDPLLPTTPVNSARVEGPGEIIADRSIFYSYQLVVDFDDLGVAYAASNAWRIEVTNKLEVLEELLGGTDPATWDPTFTGFIPTRADLSLTPLNELTDEQLEEIFQTLIVAEIDTNGYLYPRISVNAEFVVYADFDDEIQQFTRSMPVIMKPANSIIEGMTVLNVAYDGLFTRVTNRKPGDESDVNGVIKISDVPTFDDPQPNTPNSFQTYDGETLSYTFRARVERNDDLGDENGFFAPRVVEWSLDTSSDRIYLGTPNQDQINIIVDEVTDDQEVILRARYSEEFARSEESFTPGSLEGEDRLETVNASLRFIVESSKAIDLISNNGTDTVFDNLDGLFTPDIAITRRDGSTVVDPLSITTFRILGGPIGLTYDEVNKGFSIPTLQSNTTMTIRAIATEGRRTISADFVFNLQQAFQPQGIDLVLPQTNQSAIIDTALINLRSELISFDSSRQDATSRTFFFFAALEEDARIVNQTQLQVDSIAQDKTINLSLRSQDFPNTQTVVPLTVYSSFPLVGTLVSGLELTDAIFNQEINDPTNNIFKLLSRTGGTFEIDPDADEYGYFMHPKSLGRAQFAYIPEVNSAESLFGNWQGLGANPVEVVREYAADLTEVWYLYRTANRGFARGKFAVTYQAE